MNFLLTCLVSNAVKHQAECISMRSAFSYCPYTLYFTVSNLFKHLHDDASCLLKDEGRDETTLKISV